MSLLVERAQPNYYVGDVARKGDSLCSPLFASLLLKKLLSSLFVKIDVDCEK